MDALIKFIEAVADMPALTLRATWEQVTGGAPPVIAPSLLARDLTWRMQAKAHGGLDKRTARHLHKLCTAHEAPLQDGIAPPPAALAAGSRILREWGGKTHLVEVLDDRGYSYAGQTYRSLSAIARAITGARWSGPRFFGIVA